MNDVKNIMVLGCSGMLGNVLVKYLQQGFNVYSYDSKGFNILTQPLTDLHDRLRDLDYIINCAGIIKPRINNYSVEDVIKVNALFPIQLSEYIRVQNINDDEYDWPIMIHISSDCVFSGKTGNYTVDSITDATDLYGITKSLGEMAYQNALVLRTSIIGEEVNNKYSLLEWAKSQVGKKISGYTDHMWNGVTTLQLSKIIASIIEPDWFDYGIWNISGEIVSKYQLLNTINKVYNLKLEIDKIVSNAPINRTLVPYTDMFDFDEIPSIEQQLNELKEFCNER